MMETERIRIFPADRAQMERILSAERDGELRKAYGEMLAGSLAHPEDREWYALWVIEKSDGTRIGDLCFKGIGAGRKKYMDGIRQMPVSAISRNLVRESTSRNLEPRSTSSMAVLNRANSS